MHAVQTWRQVQDWEPWNPHQLVGEHYMGYPGGYHSTYYNPQPNRTGLVGADNLGAFDWRGALKLTLALTAGTLVSSWASSKLKVRGRVKPVVVGTGVAVVTTMAVAGGLNKIF